MAKNDNLTDFLTDIANAIRIKTGVEGPINPQEFSSLILSISANEEPLMPYLTVTALEDGLTASLSLNSCLYSVDGQSWNTLAEGEVTPAINAGESIMFKGNLIPVADSGIGTFTISKKFDLSGNCMSMLFGDNASEHTSLEGYPYAFKSLFSSSLVVNVSEDFLPAKVLDSHCYSYLFNACENLVTAPDLPATTIGDNGCSYMFYGCVNLKKIKSISAVTIGAYGFYAAFSNCTALAVLPATMVAESVGESGCAYMFSGCTSLSYALELPAVNLSASAYRAMFNNCTALIKGPTILPAMSVPSEGYRSMFQSCKNLETAPILPATSLSQSNCYYQLFCYCEKLSYVKALFTRTPSTTYMSNWLYGVASQGVFIKNASVSWTNTGASAVPTGWTVMKMSLT